MQRMPSLQTLEEMDQYVVYRAFQAFGYFWIELGARLKKMA